MAKLPYNQQSKTMVPGMMTISDAYHDYFDTSGNLIYDPMNPEDEEESENEEPADNKTSENEITENETEDEPDNPEEELQRRIKEEFKKHPETLISTYKAQKINAVLIELRLLAHGSGFEDFLELIKEPEEVEQDGVKYLTGMTYSDAEVLLSHYTVVLNYLRRQHR